MLISIIEVNPVCNKIDVAEKKDATIQVEPRLNEVEVNRGKEMVEV